MSSPLGMLVNRLLTFSRYHSVKIFVHAKPQKLYNCCPTLLRGTGQNTSFTLVRGAKTKAQQSSVSEVSEKKGGEVTVGAKVVQAGKDFTYTTIFIIGFAVTGGLFYIIGRELFSGQSPSGVYSNALKICKQSTEVQDALGVPIKAYGEMNRRGRRRHTSHTEYKVDGVEHMRMKFYIEGPMQKGTVHLEVKKNENGKYEYRYLFIQLDDLLNRTIILEDKR